MRWCRVVSCCANRILYFSYIVPMFNICDVRARHLHKSYRMESWLANTDAHVISVSALDDT